MCPLLSLVGIFQVHTSSISHQQIWSSGTRMAVIRIEETCRKVHEGFSFFLPGNNNTYLLCCFPMCWFFVQWRTSRRNETCADQTRRDVRIIMRTFHSVHGISTYLAQRVTRWDFMKTSCIFSFDSSMSSIGFYLNCTAKLPRYVADQEQQLMVQLNNWQIFPCLREAEENVLVSSHPEIYI